MQGIHKSKRAATIFCALLVLIGASTSFGQKGARRTSNKPSCGVGGISFTCPKKFRPWPAGTNQDFALFLNREFHQALFVAASGAGFDEQKIMSDVVRPALAGLFPKDSQEFAWKPTVAPRPISKYEVEMKTLKGFNGKLGILLNYRHLKFNGKEFFVGHLDQSGTGREAKESFEATEASNSVLMEDIIVCSAVVDVIYSITGEKVDENNPPCELLVIPG